jgi:hypothetical protein
MLLKTIHHPSNWLSVEHWPIIQRKFLQFMFQSSSLLKKNNIFWVLVVVVCVNPCCKIVYKYAYIPEHSNRSDWTESNTNERTQVSDTPSGCIWFEYQLSCHLLRLPWFSSSPTKSSDITSDYDMEAYFSSLHKLFYANVPYIPCCVTCVTDNAMKYIFNL